jgi:transposase InsO family protein
VPPGAVDTILADTGITVVLTGVQLPRMNAIMERWIKTCRYELLDRMLIFNQRHLPHALREYERHYNEHRAHRGIPTHGRCIRRRDRLGGLLHGYEHAA